jgi:hypothetical protein
MEREAIRAGAYLQPPGHFALKCRDAFLLCSALQDRVKSRTEPIRRSPMGKRGQPWARQGEKEKPF